MNYVPFPEQGRINFPYCTIAFRSQHRAMRSGTLIPTELLPH